jgi:hypothetical protein
MPPKAPVRKATAVGASPQPKQLAAREATGPQAASSTKVPLDVHDYLKALVFGYSGSGKSHLLTTVLDCPEALPALVISVDQGTRTLWRRFRNADPSLVRLAQANTTADLDKELLVLSKPHNPYKLLAIDGISTAYRRILQDIEPPLTVAGHILPTSMSEWKNATIRDRGIVLEIMTYLGDWLTRKVNVHVIVTALADDLTSDEGKQTGQTGVLLPGRLRRAFPGMFDMVGFLTVEAGPKVRNEPRRTFWRLQLLPSASVVEVRSRYADSSQVTDLVNPTVAMLLQAAALEGITYAQTATVAEEESDVSEDAVLEDEVSEDVTAAESQPIVQDVVQSEYDNEGLESDSGVVGDDDGNLDLVAV